MIQTKINKKQMNIATTIILLIIMAIYELLFCNNLFLQGETTYAFSFYRIVMYSITLIIYFKFRNAFADGAIKNIESEKRNIILIGLVALLLIDLILIILGAINVIVSSVILIGLSSLILLNFYISGYYIKDVILIMLAVGFIFSIIMPINNQLDEKRHFLSSYNLSYANFNFKKPIVNEKIQNIPQRLNFEDFNIYFHEKYEDEFLEEFIPEDITHIPAPYNPIQYIPSAIGIYTARLLNGSIADIYYTGRFFNLLGYLCLVILVLKVLPYKKKCFYVIFLMPMILALSSVYSVDGIMVGVVSIWIAYCLKLYEQKDKISFKQILILIGIFTIIGTLKSMGYIPIALIVFILPITKIIKENKKNMPLIISLVIISILANFAITLLMQNEISDPRIENTNAARQIFNIIENPIGYLEILGQHIKTTLTDFSSLSYLNGPMFFGKNYDNVFLILILFLFYVGLTDNSKNFNKRVKFVSIITFFVVLSTTSTLLYICYTPVGTAGINGYQLRYIFPMISLLLICISSEKVKSERNGEDFSLLSYMMTTFLALSIYGILL